MDVQCERCKTEYDFDDALVSGRGTTVKCTTCGHQFKVRRAASEATQLAPLEDVWTVWTTEGREVVFKSLRELQKAILSRQLGRADTLTRGGAAPRPLGAITELDPFFEEGASGRPPQPSDARGLGSSARGLADAPVHRGRLASIPPQGPGGGGGGVSKQTLVGHGSLVPPPTPSRDDLPSRPPPPPGAKRPTLRPIAGTEGSVAAPLPMRPRVDTIRPPVSANSAVPPPPGTLPRGLGQNEDSQPGARGGVSVAPVLKAAYTPIPPPPGLPRRPSFPPSSAPVSDVATSLPPPTVPVRRSYDDVAPMRTAMQSLNDASDRHSLPGRPRRVGGWVVAAVLMLSVLGVGGLAARRYLPNMGRATSAAETLDGRAQQFLEAGERALGDGNTELAKESFDKASALAERDPHVLLDVARLAAVRADVPWLRARVLPDAATDDLAANKAALDEMAPRARKAADEALAAAPDDVGAIRAKVDALRIAGDREGARGLVTKVIGNASQPETAYVLAALDLAEPEPLWPMVIERLRLSTTSEGNAGRARAALVYALARSGDAVGARSELDRLAGLTRPHPLVGALRAFVQRVPAARDGGAAPLVTSTATVDIGALPHAHARAGRAPGAGGGGGFAGASDPRTLLAQAAASERTHDFDRARALYSAALAQNPSDSEALAGLGDVAHAQRDLPGAIGYYKRALAVNPVYLPALVGMADAQYEGGNRAEAQKTYRDITERFPDGTYPPRVRQRAEASAAPAAPAPAPAGAAPASSGAATAEPESTP
jgi:predicted Zn finger-like uncharacterized protein